MSRENSPKPALESFWSGQYQPKYMQNETQEVCGVNESWSKWFKQGQEEQVGGTQCL